jgi:hypothetical protein
LSLCFAFALAISSGLTADGLELDASPTPDAVSPALCTVEAPSFDELNHVIAATPFAGTPEAERTPGIVPDGTPAPPEVTEAITSTIRELVGCFNSGELLRAFGLYTPAYLHRLFERQGGFSRAVYDSYATPEPLADSGDWTAILAIEDARIFDDRTAGATVTLLYASVPIPKRFFITLEWNGERWLIADILGEITFSVP